MDDREVDLLGQICPYPVVNLIREALRLESGQTARFCVDDPLALKSVPEELSEYEGFTLEIVNQGRHWEIIVTRR
ncbi:MAG: sulfurtransferase TusA family protein [Candidatus Krumholzibacteriota bacterium]|jgi:TusA-related sulfurtransferase|nr:sulfurtransferase TusA family protein [Candidatus Krumholzibacteriota bacterium]